MVWWIRGIVSILTVIILITAFSAMAAGEEWTVPMTYQSGTTKTTDLAFGTNVSATDGFDPNIDEPAPPLSPGATKYAYFQIDDPLLNMLYKDYRPIIDQSNPTETWTLVVTSDEQISLSWDTSNVPDNTTLIMNINGNIIDMKSQRTYTLPSGTYTIHINARLQVAPAPVHKVPVESGCTLIALIGAIVIAGLVAIRKIK